MFKILISDGFAEEGMEVFKQFKDIEIDLRKSVSPEELVDIIEQYDGLIVRSATKFKGEVIDKAKNLKIIGRAGAGVDNIDVEAVSKKGIVVMNTPGGNSSAVAELTIAMIMALSRNIVPATITMKEGKWEKKIFGKTSVEVAGKILGIIGVGNIGSIVSDRAKGLKMEVIVFDPFLTEEKAAIMGVKKVNSIDEIYKSSDYITLHLPKNEETINLINKESISKMKDGVFLINCARGGIINEKDLLDALNSGKIKAAALDVFEKEPVDPDSALVKHPNVICTPHLGASSVEAQINIARIIANQIGDYFSKGEIRNAINVPSLDAATREFISPYLDLAQKMGIFYRQFGSTNITEIEILYSGEVYNLSLTAITNSLLIGLLCKTFEGINFVNAQMIAKETGIKIVESKNPESHDYASQIILNVKHKKGTTVIKGAVFSKKIIRIVGIDTFVLDFEPKGNILLTKNKDVPGFIGEIGTVLGNSGLNISNMELGRDVKLKKALSILQIDGEIPDEVLEKVSKVSALEEVFRIKMS